MNYYCTLFDSGYLTRGLALYQSLIETKEEFKLYIIAFDDDAYQVLNNLNLEYAKTISLEEFENERLLTIKKDRTRQEYSWTCACFSILHVLTEYNLDEVTYLDSDIYFFARPSILLDEFHASDKDVLITEHRYTPKYDQTATSGKFCVQFMTFKNNENGLAVLNWWCDRCEEWCYARIEDGKFGDQKYLDDWETRFSCVHVLKHLGGGVAPWNVQQYVISDGPSVNNAPIVFYHFHGLKWLSFTKFDVSSNYKLSSSIKKSIYEPYLRKLQEMQRYVKQVDASFKSFYQLDCSRMRSKIRRIVFGTYNIMNMGKE